jgi:hypothetical protein
VANPVGRDDPGKTAVKYDKRRYKWRNRIEIMFGRLKDCRHIATRYDPCPRVFLSAIALAATGTYSLCVQTLKCKINVDIACLECCQNSP